MIKKRAGVIGTGFIGNAHVEALRRLGGVDVVAITDTYGAKEKAEVLGIENYYNDYKKMIDECSLNVVHICTPNATHYEIATYAMTRGVHVVCEKPLSTTVEDAKQMLRLAKENNVIHAVNFNNRFNPMVYEMKNIIEKYELGDIFSIHGCYVQDWLLYPTDYSWRLETALSGATRAVADIGSHWMDMAEFISGLKITQVFANLATFHPIRKKPLKPIQSFASHLEEMIYEDIPIHTEDFATLIFRFDNGAVGNVVLSQMFAGRKNKIVISIGGAKQALEWDSEKSNELWIGKRDGYNQVAVKDPSLVSDRTRQTINFPGGHVEGFPDTIKQNFAKIYRAIDGYEEDYAKFEDGLKQMVLCEKIIESSSLSKWVEV
ncbi:MAG: dehydrogenase [Clostridia bacterium]|jgi:predicted dehydrogenase|nr:dehydrogenase [Clostridia bacterium]